MNSWAVQREISDQRVLKVANEIKMYAMQNNLKFGDKLLSEAQLSENLNLSKTTIRECISRLSNVGLVKTIQGSGMFLNEITVDKYFQQFHNPAMTLFLKLSNQDIVELKNLRQIIETYSIEQYLISSEEVSLEPLEKCLEEMEHLYQKENRIAYMKVDLEFHKNLVKLSNNNFLFNLYSTIRIPTLRELEVAFSKDNLKIVHDYHKKLFFYLKEKNKEAITVIQKHLQYLVRSRTTIEMHPPL
ncbi:MAG: GntR family transcriptional regulator [Bacteroidia bacterium]|nr:GntR family transcriptional regulator [Bacteroidia bacterium]